MDTKGMNYMIAAGVAEIGLFPNECATEWNFYPSNRSAAARGRLRAAELHKSSKDKRHRRRRNKLARVARRKARK